MTKRNPVTAKRRIMFFKRCIKFCVGTDLQKCEFSDDSLEQYMPNGTTLSTESRPFQQGPVFSYCETVSLCSAEVRCFSRWCTGLGQNRGANQLNFTIDAPTIDYFCTCEAGRVLRPHALFQRKHSSLLRQSLGKGINFTPPPCRSVP